MIAPAGVTSERRTASRDGGPINDINRWGSGRHPERDTPSEGTTNWIDRINGTEHTAGPMDRSGRSL